MVPVLVLVIVLVALVALGNVAIVSASWVARRRRDEPEPELPGVPKLRVVDDRVWRGAAPTEQGYRSLAAAGRTTIVDLRAEAHVHVDEALLAGLALRRTSLPIRDGQAPPSEVVHRFLRIVDDSRGPVFLHCGAGVGRTGSMAAAYLAATQGVRGRDALARTLAVGPPSLEQLAFVAALDGRHVPRVHPLVVAISRVLDAPRRGWARLVRGR